jgi:hypothetical protein
MLVLLPTAPARVGAGELLRPAMAAYCADRRRAFAGTSGGWMMRFHTSGTCAALITCLTIREENMRKLAMAVLVLTASSLLALAAERPMRFWNLTRHTITEFYLAPAGTTNWGVNQCKNDRDGTVDHDERLRITDTAPGIYDAKFTDVSKRTCIVRNLKLETGGIFSIEESELTTCTR